MDRYMYVYTAPALKWYVISNTHSQVRSFEMIRIRISDPRSLELW